ncbi:MAG: hypothetical protein GF418_02935 [Chitinivibrionales bacterium]|nr:hypothetical protein [Chitinivibrionales bacterium]MBD3394557.1 hypothetical protein [Chitinivibrionales bacterium]
MKPHVLWYTSLALVLGAGCADYDLLEEGPDPVTLEVVSTTDSTATIRWTMSTAEDFTKYSVYYATSDIVDTTDELADTLYFRQDTIKTVGDLDADKRYYFRVVVSTANLRISISNIVEAWTDKDSRVLEFYPIDSIRDTSVVLRWEKSGISDFGRYLIYMDTTAQNVDTNAVPDRTIRINENEDTVHAVGDLTRGATYWFRVHVENTRGDIVSSTGADSATTTAGVPDTVELTKGEVTDESVQLTWTKSTAPDFHAYVIYYDTVAAVDTFTTLASAPGAVIELTSIDADHATIDGLTAGAYYRFCVYVVDKSDLVSPSNVVENYPVVLYLTARTDSTVTLGWTRSLSDRFEGYKVFRADAAGVDTRSFALTVNPIENSLIQTFVDTAVDASTEYYYRVFVYEKEPSEVSGSNEIAVTTLAAP